MERLVRLFRSISTADGLSLTAAATASGSPQRVDARLLPGT
jgi:hypothetical protein